MDVLHHSIHSTSKVWWPLYIQISLPKRCKKGNIAGYVLPKIYNISKKSSSHWRETSCLAYFEIYVQFFCPEEFNSVPWNGRNWINVTFPSLNSFEVLFSTEQNKVSLRQDWMDAQILCYGLFSARKASINNFWIGILISLTPNKCSEHQ